MITESNMKVLAVQLPIMKRDLAVLLISKSKSDDEAKTILIESDTEGKLIRGIEETLFNLKHSSLVSLPEVIKMKEEIAKHRHNLTQYAEFSDLGQKNAKKVQAKIDELEKTIEMVERFVAGRGKIYEFKTKQARNS
jgi:hypothetical protein